MENLANSFIRTQAMKLMFIVPERLNPLRQIRL